MIPLVQSIIACILIALFLPKVKNINQVTTNTWAFLILFSCATALQEGSIYDAFNQLFGINHLSWLVAYVLGITAMYFIYKALIIVSNPLMPNFNKKFYNSLLVVILFLVLIFPFIANSPKGADETNPYNLWNLLFRVVPYLYATRICWELSKILYQYQNTCIIWHVRLRWLLLFVSVFLGTTYYAIRTPYFVLVFLYPNVALSTLGIALQKVLDFLTLSRIGWAFFFLPTKFYQCVSQPLVFIDKLLALRQLNALQAELNSALPYIPPAERLTLNYSPYQKIRNLDFLLYKKLISILDTKKALYTLVKQDGALDSTTRNNTMLLYEVLSAISDDRDFDALILSYRQVFGQYRQRLA